VRFAPSPTGHLHIGGVRTALYNYLLAKATGGSLILRIEDTDQKRYVDGAEKYIIDSLAWAGITFDEQPGTEGPYGPYRQSERSHIYKAYVKRLVDEGLAYYAYDTPAELEKMRKDAEARGEQGIKYGHQTRSHMRNSLSLSAEESATLLADGSNVVVRLLVPSGDTIKFHDEIRGDVQFSSDELDDKVLLKADGLPTYHMANIVDDHLMEITHVIRGEEWLSSTAHHVLLYNALGWTPPAFAHLPLILKPTGKGKLSKRDGAKLGIPVFPMEWKDDSGDVYRGFKEEGFIPSGMLNFLAFLGWNPGTEQEIYSLDGLVEAFSLDQVVKAGARFDMDKARWFNQQHLKDMPVARLTELLRPAHPQWAAVNQPDFDKVVELLQERLTVLGDFQEEAMCFYHAPQSYEEKPLRKKYTSDKAGWYGEMIDHIETLDWDEQLEASVKTWASEKELGLGQVFPLLRLALCGRMSGPGVFEVMQLIGKQESIDRLRHSQTAFAAQAE